MKSKLSQRVVLFTLALLLGFYGSSVYHAKKAPDPKAYEEKQVGERLARRYQTEISSHPIITRVAKEEVEEVYVPAGQSTLDISNTSHITDINSEANVNEILTRWGDEWQAAWPKYLGQKVASVYIVDPTNSEMWQVVNPKDAEMIIEKLGLVTLAEVPEPGMDLGFTIITEDKRHNLYVSDPIDSELGQSIRETIAPIKGRSLLSVDLFQLVLENQIKSVSFTGYVKNKEGELEKSAFNSDNKKVIVEVLNELRKIHVSSMNISSDANSNTEKMKPVVGENNYHLVIYLKEPYAEGSQIEIIGHPLGFFAQFTPQIGKVREYTIEATSKTTNLLATLTGMSVAQKSMVSESEVPLTP